MALKHVDLAKVTEDSILVLSLAFVHNIPLVSSLRNCARSMDHELDNNFVIPWLVAPLVALDLLNSFLVFDAHEEAIDKSYLWCVRLVTGRRKKAIPVQCYCRRC